MARHHIDLAVAVLAASLLEQGCGASSRGADDSGTDGPGDQESDLAADTDADDPGSDEALEDGPWGDPDAEADAAADAADLDAIGEPDEPPTDCPVPGDIGTGDHQIDIWYGGVLRGYRFHVPPGYDPAAPTPVVFNMHGFMSNSWEQVMFSGMNDAADVNGFVALYPDGLASSWNAGSCCGTSAATGVDDVGFLRAVASDLSMRLCVDPVRLYATGMSNGGYMSHRLACEANDLFAAFAPVAGAMGIEGCAPGRPVPIIAYHGLEDPLVAYDDGRSAIDGADGWVIRNGCTGDPTWAAYGDSYCEIWETCAGGVRTGICTLDPMGHCWPGGSSTLCLPFIGPFNDDIPANQHMWTFFSDYTLP